MLIDVAPLQNSTDKKRRSGAVREAAIKEYRLKNGVSVKRVLTNKSRAHIELKVRVD